MKGMITLRVSAQELFKMFCEQLQKDVLLYCGTVLSEKEIQSGFTYKKDIAMNEAHPQIATVTLVLYEPNHRYTIVYETEKSQLQVHYEIQKSEQDHIDLLYQEERNVHTPKKDSSSVYQPKGNEKLTFLKRRQFRMLEKAMIKKRSLS